MKTSRRSIQFIKDHEGLKLVAYRDAIGVWTIGWGHTSDDKYPVKRGMKITRAMAETILMHDIAEAEAGISKLVNRPLTSDENGALVSFVFNVGIDGFRGSSLRKAINNGASNTVIQRAFGLWIKGGTPKRTIPGLVKRRSEEAALFLGKSSDHAEEARGAKRDVSPSGDGTLAVQTGTGMTGTGAVADVVREQTDQLSFIAYYSDVIQYLVIALVLAGVGITFYGLWRKFRER